MASSLGQWIDDLSQTRDERDTAQESYTALLHNLPIAAAVLDPQGGSRLLNPAQMAALTGANLEETAPRRPWLDLIHAEDRGRLEEALASARRVDIRLFSPWSSWEDTQAQGGGTAANTSRVTAAPATVAELPDQIQPSGLPRAVLEDPAAQRRLPALLRTITPLDLGAK